MDIPTRSLVSAGCARSSILARKDRHRGSRYEGIRTEKRQNRRGNESQQSSRYGRDREDQQAEQELNDRSHAPLVCLFESHCYEAELDGEEEQWGEIESPEVRGRIEEGSCSPAAHPGSEDECAYQPQREQGTATQAAQGGEAEQRKARTDDNQPDEQFEQAGGDRLDAHAIMASEGERLYGDRELRPISEP